MKTHPYLRAFLGGLFVPVLVMPVLLAVFIVARVGLRVPIPIEQALIFPMAVVPSLFGLWNMLWLGSHERTRLPIGLHGALLPLLLMPLGASTGLSFGVLQLTATEAVWFGAAHVPYAVIAPMFLAVLAGYYLVWKYVIGFLDRELGIA
jgi:phosphotransferase system  glucose/maltose/N-acetylglucosamine-specific IIC component